MYLITKYLITINFIYRKKLGLEIKLKFKIFTHPVLRFVTVLQRHIYEMLTYVCSRFHGLCKFVCITG